MAKVSEKNTQELKEAVKADPGCAEFVELAKRLLGDSLTRAEAREICLKGLNVSPRNHLGRLVLAHSYYKDGLGEFCIRELVTLQRYADVPSLKKLIEGFGDYAKPYLNSTVSSQGSSETASANSDDANEGAVVAEFDLDADFADALEDLE